MPPVRQQVVTLVLAIAVLLGLTALVPKLAALRLPGYHQGFEPEQPIAFSHRVHAGELQIDCRYCHAGAERSRHAGVPAASTCMNCHRLVKATRAQVRAAEQAAEAEAEALGLDEPPALGPVVSPELAKLYRAQGLRPEDLQPYPPGSAEAAPRPIRWRRVSRLPDHVYFDHRPHVTAGVACQSCHGPVESMERVRQVESLSMGWCLECHRAPQPVLPAASTITTASTDCSVCHY